MKKVDPKVSLAASLECVPVNNQAAVSLGYIFNLQTAKVQATVKSNWEMVSVLFKILFLFYVFLFFCFLFFIVLAVSTMYHEILIYMSILHIYLFFFMDPLLLLILKILFLFWSLP